MDKPRPPGGHPCLKVSCHLNSDVSPVDQAFKVSEKSPIRTMSSHGQPPALGGTSLAPGLTTGGFGVFG